MQNELLTTIKSDFERGDNGMTLEEIMESSRQKNQKEVIGVLNKLLLQGAIHFISRRRTYHYLSQDINVEAC